MNKMETLLRRACENGELRLLDLHLGLLLEKLAGEKGRNPDLLLAATLASAAVGCGHVCLPLEHAGELGLEQIAELLPEPGRWREKLLASAVVTTPGSTSPLILDKRNHLYLYRYFRYEEQTALQLRTRAAQELELTDPARAADLLDRLFGPATDSPDFQKIAAAMALLKPLLVISGGPGTGKTHTVARILALVQAMAEQPLRIGLAAPTGKAAARLRESILRAGTTLPPELARSLPDQAQTLHRLLGFRARGKGFRHNRGNLLHLDLLVLDEASMIDVVLMDALLQALPLTTRLILLGDQHQLASVEAGSLFADLCGPGGQGWSGQLRHRLRELTRVELPPDQGKDSASPADWVITLQTSYRFVDSSGIKTLARAVNSGDPAQLEPLFNAGATDLEFNHSRGRERETWLAKRLVQGYRPITEAGSLEEAFAAMEGFRVLCGVRSGPAGVETVNDMAEKALARRGLIPPDTDWYRGRPLIIRRNQYQMQLFNGDTGLAWPDEQGQLRAWFKDADNQLRPFTPARLPEHDTAYGLTIHKAQGSEFDEVLLLLPEEPNRVLSRELLYTGITRARTRLILCADREILRIAVKQRIRRWSGLGYRLWKEPGPSVMYNE